MSKLNDLTGKEWVKMTKSWFVLRGKTRSDKLLNHPGKFPENLAERFITFFTKKGELVLDPFMGVGSSAVAAESLGRKSIGIELNEEFSKVGNDRLEEKTIITGDSRKKSLYKSEVDFIITSPPYWNMLRKRRGNSKSQHSIRESKQLDLFYSDDNKDLGNIEDYELFLSELEKVFENCYEVLKYKKYMVVVAQNFRNSDKQYITFAWDLVEMITKIGFKFEGEQIWAQDDKFLGIWGFPTTYISNVHHHYCLVFRKIENA